MKKIINLLEQNGIKYEVRRFFNSLYLQDYTIDGLTFCIQPDQFDYFEKLLKGRKSLFFKYRYIYSKHYQEYYFRIHNRKEYEQALQYAKIDKKYNDIFLQVYHKNSVSGITDYDYNSLFADLESQARKEASQLMENVI